MGENRKKSKPFSKIEIKRKKKKKLPVEQNVIILATNLTTKISYYQD